MELERDRGLGKFDVSPGVSVMDESRIRANSISDNSLSSSSLVSPSTGGGRRGCNLGGIIIAGRV